MNLSTEQLTMVGLLLALVTALINGALVPGYIVKAAEKRHQEEIIKKDAEIARWQNLALDLGGMVGRATGQTIAVLQESKRAVAPAAPPPKPKRGTGHDAPPP